jgi:hypothetical protein
MEKNLALLDKFFESTDGREPLPQRSIPGEDTDPASLSEGMQPRMTTIQYPQRVADGVVMTDVEVPLIALVPLSMTQVSEVKLTTELEIKIDDDELLVGFPAPQTTRRTKIRETSQASSRPIATLEITLTPHHGTEGLKRIVEGYERALRAQIPS